ncbi:MAG: hypothetical protein AABX33_01950 [Nanoarchaeota archaeon]
MAWFKYILKFKLEVYNDKAKNFFSDFGIHSFERFLNRGWVKKDFGLTHKQMVEAGYISESWLNFIKWYKGGWKRFFGVKDYIIFSGVRK